MLCLCRFSTTLLLREKDIKAGEVLEILTSAATPALHPIGRGGDNITSGGQPCGRRLQSAY